MAIQHLPLQEPLASEITTVLIDLARLSEQVGSVDSGGLNAVSYAALRRVLLLCKAPRGAMLLQNEEQVGEASSTSTHPKTYRALALHNIHEEEALTLMSTFPNEYGRGEAGPDLSCWVTYRITPGDDTRIGEEGNGNLAMLREPLPNRTRQVTHILLILGWIDENDGECPAAIERCHTLLPLVADAIGAVVVGMVQAERIHELEQLAMREALHGMELLKAELLGTVSHELRSPLASIKGYAATLLRHERRLAREERHSFLLAINEASDHLEVIIERLLEVSQLETGQVSLAPSPVDIAYLAGEAITAIESRISTLLPGRFIFKVQLENIDGTLAHTAPLIMGDPRRLRQVLDNLLENAVKYSPDGGIIKVVIRPMVQVQKVLKPVSSSDGWEPGAPPSLHVPRQMLEISVYDTGLGIPSDHLERIFDRFHRVDTRLTREVNGLGLGLTICKRIVELHDGVIWAENRAGSKGSVFHVRLPMSEIPIA